MATKRPHRDHDRVILPDGTWMLLYDDGGIKYGGYDRRVNVIEVSTREGGSTAGMAIHATVTPLAEQPRDVRPRDTDYVCIRRQQLEELRYAAKEK